ncbi:MAG: hypothetical protein LBC18_08865 [Opitutaceae bacterium]|jgi:hypothetical protein|nr:hypothetical protein [Opitutaceae bacterium]
MPGLAATRFFTFTFSFLVLVLFLFRSSLFFFPLYLYLSSGTGGRRERERERGTRNENEERERRKRKDSCGSWETAAAAGVITLNRALRQRLTVFLFSTGENLPIVTLFPALSRT